MKYKNNRIKLTPILRERLRSVLTDKKETGYSLHEKLGISATTIGNYINDDSKTQYADKMKLIIICNELGIDLGWLEFGYDMVNNPVEEQKPKNQPVDESVEEMVKQILLKLNAKNDQFSNIHKDINLVRNDTSEIRKEVVHLKKEITNLKTEIEKLKENNS